MVIENLNFGVFSSPGSSDLSSMILDGLALVLSFSASSLALCTGAYVQETNVKRRKKRRKDLPVTKRTAQHAAWKPSYSVLGSYVVLW
jgi:hypothetical protein